MNYTIYISLLSLTQNTNYKTIFQEQKQVHRRRKDKEGKISEPEFNLLN